MAKEVAKELRKRGIWARIAPTPSYDQDNKIDLPYQPLQVEHPAQIASIRRICVWDDCFEDMSALEIADEIQAQEARRAQEWAGDT